MDTPLFMTHCIETEEGVTAGSPKTAGGSPHSRPNRGSSDGDGLAHGCVDVRSHDSANPSDPYEQSEMRA
eukprot:316183-Chlamydomonas_euryale.AAC.1